MSGTEPLTDDAFLGGRLQLWQPQSGYRASTDAVLLAACCPATRGQSVLDLGCGVGAAALCLGVRVPDLALAGLELQPAYASLARRNAARAKLDLEVSEGSVLEMPPRLRRSFDHVITNPPYYPPASTPPQDEARHIALHETVSLQDWISAAKRRLNQQGWLTTILRADRLGDALAALGTGMGSVSILPLTSREGRNAGRVVLRARKGGKGALRLLAPLVLHSGTTHPGDRLNASPLAEAVFRSGASLAPLFN